MTDDAGLSQRLTAAVREVDGVAGVFIAKPPIAAAAEAVAAALTLRDPDVLVDVSRADGFATFTVHLAVSAAAPTPDVLRAVGERIRDLVAAEGAADAPFAVNVRARLIEGVDPPSA